jgi:hypothetical protein
MTAAVRAVSWALSAAAVMSAFVVTAASEPPARRDCLATAVTDICTATAQAAFTTTPPKTGGLPLPNDPRWRALGYDPKWPAVGHNPKWQSLGYDPKYKGFQPPSKKTGQVRDEHSLGEPADSRVRRGHRANA